MALLPLWKRNPEEIRPYALRQIVAIAGDGRVLDGSLCSAELRAFLSDVAPEELERFTVECLESQFDGSGFALQDLVNELGARLEFDVEPGLYRGRKGATGFDGIWRGGGGLELVVEVKTTDTYNVNLDRIAGYRRDLVADGRISEESAVIFVVGRQDTGSLEAQIRGSPHAWSMRVIGVASLVRLLKVKLKSESDNVTARIKALLRPVEYTRVDGIADLMFDTATELDFSVRAEITAPAADTPEDPAPSRAPSSGASAGIEELRERIAETLRPQVGAHLVRLRRSQYATRDGAAHAIIAISKRYDRDHQAYWYALYETHLAFIREGKPGFLVLGALDTGDAYVLPKDVVERAVPNLKPTIREQGQKYWHIAIRLAADEGFLTTSNGDVPLAPFLIRINRPPPRR